MCWRLFLIDFDNIFQTRHGLNILCNKIRSSMITEPPYSTGLKLKLEKILLRAGAGIWFKIFEK